MADWELNYSDQETLRSQLVTRLRQAVRKYLLYVQGSNQSSERKAWCTTKLNETALLAEQLSHYCVSEPTFIAGGTSITDAALQSRSEYVLNTFFMPA